MVIWIKEKNIKLILPQISLDNILVLVSFAINYVTKRRNRRMGNKNVQYLHVHSIVISKVLLKPVHIRSFHLLFPCTLHEFGLQHFSVFAFIPFGCVQYKLAEQNKWKLY